MTCIVIILGRNLEFQCFDVCPDKFKDSNLQIYDRKFIDGDNGFYDWLRDPTGSLIGVRWFPYDESLLHELRDVAKFEFVELSSDYLEVKIFFSENRLIDEARSCDQDFLENNIYYSPEGGCAISFSMKGLDTLEQSTLCLSQ